MSRSDVGRDKMFDRPDSGKVHPLHHERPRQALLQATLNAQTDNALTSVTR